VTPVTTTCRIYAIGDIEQCLGVVIAQAVFVLEQAAAITICNLATFGNFWRLSRDGWQDHAKITLWVSPLLSVVNPKWS
jgi:hypothetical protein